MSGWPDPARPGVPLNPERDGWHWVRESTGLTFPLAWDAPAGMWHSRRFLYPTDVAAKWRYVAPLLTPAEVAAREAAAFKRGAEAMREKAALEIDCRAVEIGRLHARYATTGFPVGGPSIAPEEAQAVARTLEREALNIRALPVPPFTEFDEVYPQ